LKQKRSFQFEIASLVFSGAHPRGDRGRAHDERAPPLYGIFHHLCCVLHVWATCEHNFVIPLFSLLHFCSRKWKNVILQALQHFLRFLGVFTVHKKSAKVIFEKKDHPFFK
jgi:hypothetical protein